MTERVSVGVRVLLYPGELGDQAWVAQGIEYDVFGSGADEEGALRAFELAFADEVAWALEQGRAPLENVPAAPTKFRDLLTRAVPFGDPRKLRLPSIPSALQQMDMEARMDEVRVCSR